MMVYKFKLPIGDWSNDGHGEVNYYSVESNKPVQELRELYFKACKQLGYTLDGHDKKTPCAKHRDYVFSKEVLNDLLNIGVTLIEEIIDYIQQVETVEPEMFAEIVLEFIKSQDKTFEYKIVNDFVEMLQFYGFDEKNRHIGHFGYGLFD